MVAFYTAQQKRDALTQLHINPKAVRVNSTQAASILTWRAREEYGVILEYDATAVRKHTKKLDAQPALLKDGSPNMRQNTYSVSKLFEIDITPSRTNQRNKKIE